MIKILKPGLLTSFQDLGRYGYQKYGVIASGAMDQVAHRISNILVGNDDGEATIEITLSGPAIEFASDALISICGADLSPEINGDPAKLWRPIFLESGSVLKFGKCKNGCRAYLAIAGGYSIPREMGSSSTYLRAGIGGWNGRALKMGDEISLRTPGTLSSRIAKQLPKKSNTSFREAEWTVAGNALPMYETNPVVRITKGAQYGLFDSYSIDDFLHAPFKITSQSDRMGYRLEGSKLMLKSPVEMISEAVRFGTIQVPSEGHPIILLADRQTTGGYPKIAEIATVDIPLVAQSKPGESLKFQLMSLEESQQLLIDREENIKRIKQGVLLKYT
ncbi:biotin-dependent carboxyltransferase family protein [Peribacillus sp. SCS-155]|uniref:5-oxoprolinase subunit C family protein n=1 Tax=Peribacillus sedimenti TaxID=3115297 RepID=UPI0039063754